MTLFLLWLQFAAAAAIILGASHFLTRSADVIALKTGLGRAFIGVALLGTATSLPELATGISSVTLVGEPDLASGTAFGSNLFNLLIVGLLDVFWRNGPILNRVSKTSTIVGIIGIVIIGLSSGAILIHNATDTMAGWYLSPLSGVILGVFVAAIYITYRFRGGTDSSNGGSEEVLEDYDTSLSRAVMIYILMAIIVIGSATWLAEIGDGISDEMDWEASFVGTQFLALSTSLPELATSFSAIRIGVPELAITNVLGSNLFNMGFILFVDDLAYSDGVLWAASSKIHALTGLIAIVMTSVVILALFSRPRKRISKYLTAESMVLISLYLAASFIVFNLG